MAPGSGWSQSRRGNGFAAAPPDRPVHGGTCPASELCSLRPGRGSKECWSLSSTFQPRTRCRHSLVPQNLARSPERADPGSSPASSWCSLLPDRDRTQASCGAARLCSTPGCQGGRPGPVGRDWAGGCGPVSPGGASGPLRSVVQRPWHHPAVRPPVPHPLPTYSAGEHSHAPCLDGGDVRGGDTCPLQVDSLRGPAVCCVACGWIGPPPPEAVMVLGPGFHPAAPAGARPLPSSWPHRLQTVPALAAHTIFHLSMEAETMRVVLGGAQVASPQCPPSQTRHSRESPRGNNPPGCPGLRRVAPGLTGVLGRQEELVPLCVRVHITALPTGGGLSEGRGHFQSLPRLTPCLPPPRDHKGHEDPGLARVPRSPRTYVVASVP